MKASKLTCLHLLSSNIKIILVSQKFKIIFFNKELIDNIRVCLWRHCSFKTWLLKLNSWQTGYSMEWWTFYASFFVFCFAVHWLERCKDILHTWTFSKSIHSLHRVWVHMEDKICTNISWNTFINIIKQSMLKAHTKSEYAHINKGMLVALYKYLSINIT